MVFQRSFPDNTHALAGAVFNTLSPFGASVGLAAVFLIYNAVDKESHAPVDLLEGYRASFGALFGAAALTCVVGALELRRLSDKGMKEELDGCHKTRWHPLGVLTTPPVPMATVEVFVRCR